MRQAPMTVDLYLRSAIECVDGALGEGYAHKHPELVAAFVQACAADFNTASISYSLQGMRDSLREVAAAIERDGP